MLGFATLSLTMSIGGIYAAMSSNNISTEDAWDSVDVTQIK